MSSRHRNYRAVIKLLLFTWLVFAGSTLIAQQEEPKPASPITATPHKSNEAPDESRKLDNASPEEEVQIQNLERYTRVPVIGLITEGGAPIALDPPSDDEVLLALEKARPTRSGISLPSGKHGKIARITKEKIADYVDPPRFVPLIGMAQLHHAHYKCTIYFSERADKEATEVIYIDHNHFHRRGNGPPPAPPAPQAPQVFNFSMGIERGESLESLKQRYNEFEQQTHQLANKLKQSRSPSETERKELQAAVRKSFEARQALHRAELADLAKRMQSMQQSIDMRDKLADEVVERRVEDLLNPSLKWNETTPVGATEREIESASANRSAKSSGTAVPKYSGHPISWWLDNYWDNALASQKTAENAAQEYVAYEAIRKLREKPESNADIEAALARWFASVEHEVNEGQLTRAARCIVTVAGPKHQETAVKLLFRIWKSMPILTFAEQGEMVDDASELNQLLTQLALNDQLAGEFAERLANGDSSDRSLVLYGLLSLMGRSGIETNRDLTQIENWLRQHAELLARGVEAACRDANEQIRFTALNQLAALIHVTKLDPESTRLPKVLLDAASDTSPSVRWIAIKLLTSNELAPAVQSQNIQITPMLIQAIKSDSSVDVSHSALEALMRMNEEGELVHKTLMEWAKSDNLEKVKVALDLTLLNDKTGNRPQSIDELIELLSHPDWGTKVEINYNQWSTHHRWARQYAFAILGRYAAHAHRATPTLEAELARNNKDTLSFATQALDRVRGYCPDLPIERLQGDWEFVSMQKPEGSSPFLDLQASSDQQPASVITIQGTQLKLGARVLAEISHPRLGSGPGVTLLLDPNGKKLPGNGRYDFNPEFQISSSSKLEWLKLEVRALLDDSDATERSKQIYEFCPNVRIKPIAGDKNFTR